MSVSRQQRRAMQRRMKGITGAQAEELIKAVKAAGSARWDEARKLAPSIVDDVLVKMRKDWEPMIRKKVRDQTIDDMLVLVMAYEHIDRRHTGRYLANWLHGFMDFSDAVGREGSGVDGLRQILFDECGIDVIAEISQEK